MPEEIFPTSTDETEQLVRDLMEQATDEAGNPIFPDLDRPGSPAYNMREIWTRILQSSYRRMNASVEDSTPLKAQGQSLDRWAEFFGMPRTGAKPASGEVLFQSEVTGSAAERLKGTRQIPKGTRLRVGTVRVETTAGGELGENGDELTVSVKSVRQSNGTIAETGAEVTFISDSPLESFLSGELLSSLSGGQSAETDAQLRARLKDALRAPSSVQGLRARILGLEDVSDVEITRGAYGPGTVEAYVTPAVASPGEVLRTRIENLPSGPANIHVVFPQYEAIALKVEAPGASDPVSTIADYINNVETGGSIIISQLESQLINRGARDAQVLAMKRGKELSDGSFKTRVKMDEITNITAKSNRSRFVTREDWITMCG